MSAVLVFFVVGLALRLIRLNTPVWGDETWTWAFARRTPFVEMWNFASYDPSPPLYYALLHFTMPVIGHVPFGLRFPSVFFGVLTLPVIYWSMRQASFSRVDGFYAVMLAAVSSVLIYYSQEARAYAMLAFLGTLSVGLLFRCLKNSSLINNLSYAFTIVLLSYTHRYGLFLVLAQMVCLALFKQWRTLLVSSSVCGVIVLLLLLQVIRQSFNLGAAGDITDAEAICSLINTLNVGTVGMQHDTKIATSYLLSYPDPRINQILPLVGLLVFSVVFLLGAVRIKSYAPAQRQYILVLCICTLVPASLGVLAGSPLSPAPQWLLRGLIYIWPLYYMGAVAACSRSRVGASLLAIVVVLNGLSLYPYYTTYARFGNAMAFERLNSQTTSDDLIVSDPWYMYEFISYYYHGDARLVGFHEEEGWLDAERMRQINEPRLLPLSAAPRTDGNVYVYYRKSDLKWAAAFPDNDIFVYDRTTTSWRRYGEFEQ